MAKTCMKTFLQRLISSPQTPALAGGLALQRNKPGLPVDGVIRILAVPATVSIPLTNYKREILQPGVHVGQHIKCGDMLAQGIVASCSGEIIGIEPSRIAHPSEMSVPCVIIKTSHTPDADTAVHTPLNSLTIDRIERCAVHGLGGAGFVTADKFRASGEIDNTVETLIINAVECEPVISCDEALMMSEAANLVEAIASVVDMTGCKRCILAIENDKHQAITALKEALQRTEVTPLIELTLLTPIYPSGAERPLVRRLTGIHLTPGTPPSSHGIVCINIATAYAAWQAKLGYPMTSRIVTVAGKHINQAVNVRVVFGTSISEVLKQTGNTPTHKDSRVRVGGPLSGFDLSDLNVPVTATTHCITVDPVRKQDPVLPCIRCNACSEVCPVDLLPQQLHWFATADDQQGSLRFGLMDCIECGCCDAVCPSNIALTQTFRYAKGLHREVQTANLAATESENRYRCREQRETERAAKREQKREAARARLSERADPIADALSRVRGKRKPSPDQPAKTSEPSPGSSMRVNQSDDDENDRNQSP